MEPPEVTKTVRVNPDAREAAHVRSFTRWINAKLSKVTPKLEVTDLYNDLRNGQILITLLEVLTQNRVRRENGKLRIHHTSNVKTVLDTLDKEGVVLHGISSEAIVDGKPKLTLGLVWCIILHYQVHGSMMGHVLEPTPPTSPTTDVNEQPKPRDKKSRKKKSDVGVELKMLRWVQSALEGYDDVVEVNDLSKSWRNGLAFNSLIHVYRNDLIDLEAVEGMSNKERLRNAFNVAERDLHVQKLLEPSDMDQEKPDKKLVMMYVASLSEVLREYQPVKRTKRRKVVEEFVESSAASNAESSIPEPSPPFVQFKEELVKTSTVLQKTENNYQLLEKIFRSRVDLKAWEVFEEELQSTHGDIRKVQDMSLLAKSDAMISSSETEEISSDMFALESRWSALCTRSEVQRNSANDYREHEEQELEQWKKQREIYVEWVDQLNKRLDAVEATDSQENLTTLGEQAAELKRLGQALNSDPFPQRTLEIGRGILLRDVLRSENLAIVKEQVIVMEKQLEGLKSRAARNIDKLNNNIDMVKSLQHDQMSKWRKQAEAMCDWLDTVEEKLEGLVVEDSKKDIKIISKNLKACESLQEALNSDEKPHSIMEYGETLLTENSLSNDQRTKIDKQLKEMNNEWRSLLDKAAKLKARLVKERETRQQEEKHKVEEWIKKFEILMKKLTKVKEDTAEFAKISDVEEKEKRFQESMSSVEAIKPEYQTAVECAKNVLSNDACPDWEKSQVKEDADMLRAAWGSVLEDLDDGQKSIDALHAAVTNDQLSKMQKWREKYIEVQEWYEMISPKIEGDFVMAKTLPAVRKQVADHEALLNEMVTTHETVEYLLNNGQELLQNKSTPEAEKNKLRKDIAKLVERWESLSDPLNNRMQRLSEMEKHLQGNLDSKLDEWTNLATAVESWLTKAEKKFQALGVIAPNLEAAMKQKPRAEALAKEVKQEEKKLNNAARVGEEILGDSLLSDDDSNKLQQELNTLKNRWQALDEKITWRVQRLDDTISKLGSQQDDKLEKWRENAKQISDWLDKAQLRLAERGPIGSDLKSVTSQKEEFQVFVHDSLSFQNHIYEFTEFSENLRTDPCINEEERAKVQQKTKSLNDRWDGIVQQINNHDNALETRMDELEEKHQHERLAAWKDKSEPLQKWLTAKAIEMKSLKEIGNDLLTVEKQLKETKVLKTRIDNYGKHFRECLSLADEIQKDPLIEDEKATAIQDLAQDMTNRWGALKYALEGRLEKLSKKETEFQDEKSSKVSKWQTSLSSWRDWLKAKESELDSQGVVGTDPSVIKSQKVAAEGLHEEVKKENGNWDILMALADEILSMQSISDDDRRQVQQEKFGVKNQWDSLKDNIDWRVKRLGTKETEILNERTVKTQEWKTKALPLQDWIKKKETKADSLQNVPEDFETVSVQINEVQMLLVDIDQKEKQLKIIYRLGEDLSESPSLSDEDRAKLNDDVTTLKQRWTSLTDKVQTIHKNLSQKKDELVEERQTKFNEWQANAGPFEQWLTEEGKKFDGQALPGGANLDLVKKKREETEGIFNALLANTKRLNDVEQIYGEVQSHPSLSTEDKRKLLQEMTKIRTMWKALEEKMEAAVKKLSNKENDLEKEREHRLTEWETKREMLQEWMNEKEEKLNNCEEIPHDLDHVRKEIKNAKGMMDDFINEMKEFRILSRLGDESQSHPCLFEKDRECVRQELGEVKTRWKTLEEGNNERLKRLTEEEKKLLDVRASGMAEWKETASPVKDWIAKQEKKIELYTSPKNDHESVMKQRQQVESMSDELNKRQVSVTQLDTLHGDIQLRPSLSEEDKKKLRQDYNSIKNGWNNVEEAINQAYKRLSKQEGSFNEERVVKIDEWQCKSAPLQQLFSEQGTKWEDDQDLESSDLETVRKYKQATQVDVQAIQKQQVELENAIRLGEEVQKHSSLKDEDRARVRMEMSNLRSQWQNLESRMHKKRKRLSSREVALTEERSNLLGNLKNERSDFHQWLAKQEKKLASFDETAANLDSLQKLKVSLETIHQEVRMKDNHLQNVIERGNSACAHGSLSDDDKKTIQQDVNMLQNDFKALTQKIEERLKRVHASEKDIQGQKDSKLVEWRDKLALVEAWLAAESNKLETDKNDAEDLDSVSKQKRVMEDVAKDIELQEKQKLTGVSRFGEDLKTHVNLSDDDRRKIQEDIEILKTSWENLREKINWKIKRLSEKETELREQSAGKLQEWKNAVSPLQEWLLKEDQKAQEGLAIDMVNLKRQKQECLDFRKDLELQQKRVDNVASFGAEISKHPSLSEENRRNMEQCILTIRNDWERLDEKNKWRLSSIEEKERDLKKDRDMKLQEWRAKLEAMQSILEEHENTFKFREGIATDLETVKYKKSEVEDMLKELELEQKKELGNIILFGQDVSKDPSMSLDDTRKINQDIGNLKSSLENLEEKMKWRAKRLSEKEKELEQFRSGKLSEWKKSASNLQEWIKSEETKLEVFEELPNDLDVLREQKTDIEAQSGVVEGEKVKVNTVVQMGDQLLEHPSLFEEDRKQVESHLETIQTNWSLLLSTINKRMERIVTKEAQLDIEITKISVEWRQQVDPLRTWINDASKLTTEDSGIGVDMDFVRKQKTETESLTKAMDEKEDELRKVIHFGYKVQENPSLTKNLKDNIQKESASLKHEWDNLESTVEEKTKSVNKNLRTWEDEQATKLSDWRETCKPLSDWLDQADHVISSSDVTSSGIEDTKEHQKKIEALLEEAKKVEPKIVSLQETAQTYQQEPSFTQEDRKNILDEAERLSNQFSSTVERIKQRQNVLAASLQQLTMQYQDERLTKWSSVSDPALQWINTQDQNLESLHGAPQDLTSLQKQQKTTEALLSDVAAYKVQLDSVTDLHAELSEDDLVNDEATDVVAMQAKNIKNKWRNLNEKLQARSESLSMMLTKLLNERQKRLAKWNDQLSPVSEWLTEKQQLLESPESQSPDIDTARDEKNEFVDLVIDLETHDETLDEIFRVDFDSLNHPSIPDDERAELKLAFTKIQNTVNDMRDKAEDRAKRLKGTVRSLESEQKGKLKTWRMKRDEVTDELKNAEGIVSDELVVGSNIETVTTQKENLQNVLERCLHFQQNIYDFTTFSEKLRTDRCISGVEKLTISTTTETLNKRWDLVVAQLKTRSTALERQLDDLEARHVGELMRRWKTNYEPFSRWLMNTENEIKSLQAIGDNAVLVQKQQQETQVLRSRIDEQETAYKQVLSVSETINNDPLIEDREADAIDKLSSNLTTRWEVMKESVNTRSQSLVVRESFLSEHEQNLLHEWRRNVEPFSNWLSKVEKDGSDGFQGHLDMNTIKDYSVRCKTLDREVEGRKPVLDEIEKLGEKLLEDTTVRGEEKSHIKDEMERLLERWENIHVTIHDNTKWADIKLIELAKKEQETLDVWKKNVEPFNTWLDETDAQLKEIEQQDVDTENLKEKHQALQRIKEDVTRHEEALSRIVTIVDKLTADENISETEKNNIKAEMNRLQNKWNTVQNDINLNYLTVTESLMELAQKEKTTLEEWKHQTDPFKEWLVEAKGRTDSVKHAAEGYDVIAEQKEKLEALSREIKEGKEDYENICQLKTTILEDENLSKSFKDNITREGESLDQKWKELCETVSTHGDRAYKHMVSLEGSQRSKLDKWQTDCKVLNDLQSETESELKSFETLALDVDNAKKQATDLKAVEEKIEANRSGIEEVSSFCTEISTDPDISKQEKTRVKKEMDTIKEKHAKHIKGTGEHQRRIEAQIRDLQDQESAKLKRWHTSSQPLHEWLDGMEDDAKEYDIMEGTIGDAQTRFDELQKLTKEFKETEADLFNVLKLGEELSSDAQVSREVRDTVTYDVATLRENHGNVSDLINSQREKMKSQLLKLQQHQEKCLIDWNQRKISINARVKAMEKRTLYTEPVGDNFEGVQGQKDELKTTAKELESIEHEVVSFMEYGETLCQDKSIVEGEKEGIRDEMKTIERSLSISVENVEERKSSLNAKLETLRQARANEFLSNWRKQHSVVTKWMDTCEGVIKEQMGDPVNLGVVREHLDEIDVLSEKIESFEPEYVSAVKAGEDVVKEPSVASDEKEQVESELSDMKTQWQGISDKLESLMIRLEDAESSLLKRHDQDSDKFYVDLEEARAWCEETRTRLQDMKRNADSSNYDRVAGDQQELEIIVEKLPKYEVQVRELGRTCQRLARDSKNKTESENFIQENKRLQKDFENVKETVEILEDEYGTTISKLESEHNQKLSEWNKKGERVEQKLSVIEEKWRSCSFLEGASREEVEEHRQQLQEIVASLDDLQSNYERYTAFGRQLSTDHAIGSETRDMIQQKLYDYEKRWNTVQTARKLHSKLPLQPVVEGIVKVEDEKQVESIDQTLDDLFGVDSVDGPGHSELVDWNMDFETVLQWCVDAETKIETLNVLHEYLMLVERQHLEIEEMIQAFTSYEDTVTQLLEKGDRMLSEAETLRLSRDEKTRLRNDVSVLRLKWSELQEKAFDTERRLNEHVNKLREFQDWKEKASALCQWLDVTHRKLDCCNEPSDDLDEREKQKIFLQKFSMEKQQNEESINDVLNLGRYIVANHLVLKEKYDEVTADVKNFKDVWGKMLDKAEDFCKIFGVEFSHIDMDSSDPFTQWKMKVKELEKWLADANEKLSLKKILKDYNVLSQLPEVSKEISEAIDSYCVVQLNEITSKGQDILNSKKNNPIQNAEITDTVARLAEEVNALRLFAESQKVHVRNTTLEYFNERLSGTEKIVENIQEDLLKLKNVANDAGAVKGQVDIVQSSEESLQKQFEEFEETKRQLAEMEEKGYLSSEGFEGTLKVKTTELEPKLVACEKQFTDTKTRLAKGVINFHGQHRDDVKKWLRQCERQLNDISTEKTDINEIYDEYEKIQEVRRGMLEGERDFLNALELNEKLISEDMFNDKQGREHQVEIMSVAKWRNQLQRQVQEKDASLYTALIEGLESRLTSLTQSFTEAEAKLSQEQLSADFDTATEQMDGAKRLVEKVEILKKQAHIALDLSQKLTTMGMLVLKEKDKDLVAEKAKELRKYYNNLPGKSRDEFNRLFDAYLALFRKEIAERKKWIDISENRISSSYMDIDSLAGFMDELNDHKEFENELNNRDMKKMSDAAERVVELEYRFVVEVRNMTKRWFVLKQWCEDYSLDLQRIVKEWRVIDAEMKTLTDWLDPHENEWSELSEKINCSNPGEIKRELNHMKTQQLELEERRTTVSSVHHKGMSLMKFLNDQAAGSRVIHQDLDELDRRWNTLAKDYLSRIELLQKIVKNQGEVKEQKGVVNNYIDKTNEELDDHETKSQRLLGNVPEEMIENGETAQEKRKRLRREKETDQHDVNQLEKLLQEKITEFPKYQSRVDNINSLNKEIEDIADEDSKTSLHEELATFNARWQVIVTRLEDYSDNELPRKQETSCAIS